MKDLLLQEECYKDILKALAMEDGIEKENELKRIPTKYDDDVFFEAILAVKKLIALNS